MNPPSSPSATSPSSSLDHRVILVVDDEPDFLELLSFKLKAMGCSVLTASSGLEALFMARRHLPDLIIVDMMMEGIDGFSVTEILQRQPSTRLIPVIMVTAAAGPMARRNALAAGAHDLLVKPFSPAVLRSSMTGALAKAERLQTRLMTAD